MKSLNNKEFNDLLIENKSFIEATARRFTIGVMDTNELAAAAFLGFYEACLRYNPDRDVSITTFSFSYIRGEVIRQEKEIYLPHFTRHDFEKFKSIKKLFNDPFYGESTTSIDIEKISERTNISEEEIIRIYNLSKGPLSWEDSISYELPEKYIKSALLPENDYQDTSLEANNFFLRIAVELEVNKLKHNQREFILFFYGLNGLNFLKKTKIAQRLKISYTRMNQISKQAENELRRNRNLKQLYLEQVTETFIYGQEIDTYFIND